MSKKIIFSVLPLFFLLFSWSNPHVNNANLADEIATTNQLIQLINDYRLSIGKPLLIRNSTADKLASEHTIYMTSKEDVSNDNFETRWEALEQKVNAEEISENIGFDLNAQKAMDACLNNIWLKVNVEGDYTHTGIAVKKDDKGRYYYTQIFYR